MNKDLEKDKEQHKKLNDNEKPLNEEATEGLELFTEGSNGPLFNENRKLHRN